jgi:hypothetical protein
MGSLAGWVMPFDGIWRSRMTKRGASLSFLVLGAALAWPTAAQADIMLLLNPNQFSGNETLLTFEGVQPFENVTSFGGVGFQYVGQPAGSGLQGAFDPTPRREFGPQEGTILNQFEFGTQGVRLTFPSAINRAAFELRTFPNSGGELSIDLFAAGAAVESFTIPNRDTSDYLFYGFESSTPFDTLILRGPGDGRFGLDNLRFENAALAVPEPAALTLLGVAGMALLGYRWRQRTPGVQRPDRRGR